MSGTIRFCADTHFGHEKMAIKRGFQNAKEQDEFIIKKWNEVVDKRDTTYILGDITMEKKDSYPLLERLNGEKRAVLGNHDSRKHISELLKYVISIEGCVKYKKSIFLTHIPVHPIEFDYRLRYNIHGHIHELVIPDERYICVSMEQIGYQPKTLLELGIDMTTWRNDEDKPDWRNIIVTED